MFWRAVGPVLLHLLIFLAVGLAQGIAAFESLRFRIPEQSELTTSSGTLFFDAAQEFKRGLPLGVRTPQGDIFVSCRTTTTEMADCIPHGHRASLVGKPITVSWIEEPIFLWQREKRAFRIEIDGSVYLSNSELVRRYQNSIPDWYSICLSLLILGGVAYAIAYRCNRELARVSHMANEQSASRPSLGTRP